MSKVFITLFFLLLGLLAIMCKNQEFKTDILSKSIVIDGDASDWNSTVNWIEEEQISLSHAVDSHAFYLLIQSPDRRYIRLLISGATLWVKTDQKQKIGIYFPPLMENWQWREIMGSFRNSEDDLSAIIGQKLVEIRIIDSEKQPIRVIQPSGGDVKDVLASIGFRQNQLVMEIRIPFGCPTGNGDSLDFQQGHALTLDWEIPEMSFNREDHLRGNRPTDGGDFPRGSGMSPGGMPPRRQGDGNRTQRFSRDPISLDWKVRLVLAD